MMTKPETPSVIINNSDNADNDDLLFGVNTSDRLVNDLKMTEIKNTVKEERFANDTTKEPTKFDPNSIDIIFEDELEPTLDDAKTTGGAITETYETPTIKKM